MDLKTTKLNTRIILNINYIKISYTAHLWAAICIFLSCWHITLTAAWWCVSVWSGVAASSEAPLCVQIFRTLSLPPLANSLPSGLHCIPHTSWLWPKRDPTWCDATRTSWWWIAPLREPLKMPEEGVLLDLFDPEFLMVWPTILLFSFTLVVLLSSITCIISKAKPMRELAF